MKNTTITWYGEFDDKSEDNLKRLSEDLGVTYQFTFKDGKKHFRFLNIGEDKSLRLVSTIRRYGLSVSTNDPISGLIKENLEALNKVSQND